MASALVRRGARRTVGAGTAEPRRGHAKRARHQHVTRAQQAGPYPYREIEEKWQRRWEEEGTFRTPRRENLDVSKPKFFALDMFPYPSAEGLHVGHPEGYTATDIVARYKRMRGYNVLHPMGFDAFGLPAEQHAKETGTHPRETTEGNVERFRSQLKALGFSYDWSREISTCDPSYYRWTQWIFCRLLEHGLAYRADVPVNWCPALGTVLANEEVVGGVSERGGHPVYRVPMQQWVLNITAYADRLLEGLDRLDWPESIKEQQRNWIGRSEGAEISFDTPAGRITAFTTRPDTLHGVTFLALAPEHPSGPELARIGGRLSDVESLQSRASAKGDLERTSSDPASAGAFTGAFATHPISGEALPVYVAEYVLGQHGTGAVMGVPAHDSRDLRFALAHDLPVREAVRPESGEPWDAARNGAMEKEGIGVGLPESLSSSEGRPSPEVREAVCDYVERCECGKRSVSYRLRDWVFARQRYWGEPFPVVLPDDGSDPAPVSDEELPVELPRLEGADLQPAGNGEGPLANAREWVKEPMGGQRETSTMPQWAGSCWYYLRFIDPWNEERLVGKEEEEYWMPVDLYVGGAEHAVLHLLYARFWHKFLYDIGMVSTDEPFHRLVTQGMILGEPELVAPWDTQEGDWAEEEHAGTEEVRVSEEEVSPNGWVLATVSHKSVPVFSRAHKMSKSRGNVINPDEVIRRYGADSMRLYEMFMGPLTETKQWSMKGVEGVHRFLARVWRLVADGGDGASTELSDDQARDLHRCVKRVTEDTEGLRFNTAIAAMMELVNAMNKWETRPPHALRTLALILAPYAPHLAEEAWERLGGQGSLAYEEWPTYEPGYVEDDTVTLPVQVNGRVRGQLEVAKDAPEDEVLAKAKSLDSVAKWLDGKAVERHVYRPGRIVNLVVK